MNLYSEIAEKKFTCWGGGGSQIARVSSCATPSEMDSSVTAWKYRRMEGGGGGKGATEAFTYFFDYACNV